MKLLSKLISLLSVAVLASRASAEILVGIAGPFSGSALALGEQIEIGALRAIDDLNENGGVLGQQVVASSADDACDSEQAKVAARQLVAEGAVFVVGHACSSASIAGGPIYDETDIVMISPSSTNPKLTDAGLTNVFRMVGRDDAQGEIAGDYLADVYGSGHIAILHDGSAFGQGLAEITKARLNELGVTEALFDIYAPDQTAYTELVDKLVKADIDVIYIGGYQGDAGIIIRQAKSQLSDILMVGGDALATEDFSLIAGDAGIGTYFTFSPDARETPAAAKVVAAFRDDEAFEPSGYTLFSYAAVQVWAQAVEKAGTLDGVTVARTLRKMEFETVVGPLGFDRKGDVTGLKTFIWNVVTEDGYTRVE